MTKEHASKGNIIRIIISQMRHANDLKNLKY